DRSKSRVVKVIHSHAFGPGDDAILTLNPHLQGAAAGAIRDELAHFAESCGTISGQHQLEPVAAGQLFGRVAEHALRGWIGAQHDALRRKQADGVLAALDDGAKTTVGDLHVMRPSAEDARRAWGSILPEAGYSRFI